MDSLPIYPVERPTIYGGDEEENVHSSLRVEFKAPPFLTGFNLKQESRSMVMLAVIKNQDRVSLDNIFIYLYIFPSSIKI